MKLSTMKPSTMKPSTADADSAVQAEPACLPPTQCQLSSGSTQRASMCKASPTNQGNTSIGQAGGLRMEGIHSVHLVLSGTATFGVIAGLIIFCYIKRKKMGCMSSPSQPVTPSAPAMQNHLPLQLQQFQQQQQQLQLPTPAVNHLALPQHQMQQEIRLMIETEMTRAMHHQRTPTTHPSFESAPGLKESPDYKLA